MCAFSDFLKSYRWPLVGCFFVLTMPMYEISRLDLDRKFISYAVDNEADYMAREVTVRGTATYYKVYHQETFLGSIELQVPGRHNVANSLAAVAVGLYIGLEFAQIAENLASFRGVKRRFQTKGRVNGVWIVDDYAHHPTEVMTTLSAAEIPIRSG